MLAFGLLVPAVGFAQQYAIPWWIAQGGGGTSANGVCSLTCAIGQHEAGNAMSGGDYSARAVP